MAIYYKEMAKELAERKATITITDNGKVVKRKAIGTFASRAGRQSYWGVLLDEPIDNGDCNGVTCNCIIDFSFDEAKTDLTPNQKVIVEKEYRQQYKTHKKANDDADFMDKLSKALQSVVNQVQYS